MGAVVEETWIVKLNVPATEGVPPKVPVLVRVKPGGAMPEMIVQTKDDGPVAAIGSWKKAFTTPNGRGEFVVIASCGWIRIESALDALEGGLLLSLTPTVKLNVPGVSGVPEIVPSAPMFKPEGNDPA